MEKVDLENMGIKELQEMLQALKKREAEIKEEENVKAELLKEQLNTLADKFLSDLSELGLSEVSIIRENTEIRVRPPIKRAKAA